MLEATADESLHSVIEGSAPAGSTLRISKSFQTSTSPVWRDDLGNSIGNPIRFTDTLSSELKAPGGSFTWDVNPSTRPLVAGRYGRDATGPPQEPIALVNPPGVPPRTRPTRRAARSRRSRSRSGGRPTAWTTGG